MLKKTVTFTDYNGKEQSTDLYFHISKAAVLTAPDPAYKEIMVMAQDLQERGKYLTDIEGSINRDDPFDPNAQLVTEAVRIVAKLLDRLVDLAYGERSSDGSHFVKNETVLNNFKSSAAYEAFVEQMLMSKDDDLLNFINQLLAV